jgi:hypothetical protein
VTARTESEDLQSGEIRKIDGRGKIRRNPKEGQTGPERKG